MIYYLISVMTALLFQIREGLNYHPSYSACVVNLVLLLPPSYVAFPPLGGAIAPFMLRYPTPYAIIWWSLVLWPL